MKIVFVSNWFSENMGYIENCLPKALVKQGHDVYLLTSRGQVYFNQTYYENSYGKFLGEAIQPLGLKIIDGVKVYRLEHYSIKKRIILKGLMRKIWEIKPDIVHTFEHSEINTLKLVFTKFFTPFKLFTANHTSALGLQVSRKDNNGFTLSKRVSDFFVFKLPGFFISFFIKKCFCVTIDAGEVAVDYFGVQKNKIKITTLGVDTEIFKPDEAVKQKMREELGYSNDDIICIYTGKFSKLKNAIIIAHSIQNLNNKNIKYKALFVGDGEQQDDIAALENCKIIPFQQQKNLPKYYQMCDIAMWPFGESSSQLDAVACGLCLILSNEVTTYNSVDSETEFTENAAYRPKIVSRFYETHDLESLTTLLESLKDLNERNRLKKLGIKEIQDIFSWDIIASRRVDDYKS